MSICAARTMNGSPTLDETCGKHFIDSKIDAGNPEEFRQQNLCDLLENSKNYSSEEYYSPKPRVCVTMCLMKYSIQCVTAMRTNVPST